MLIRQQRPRGRLPVPDTLPRQDPSLDIRHVKDKFTKTKDSPWLAERLGKSITERRDFILYRQAHQHRMRGSHEDSTEGAFNVSEPAPSTVATSYKNVPEISLNPVDELESFSRLSTRTGETSFATALSGDEGDELRIPELTRLVFNKVQLQYNEEFECPFCRTIQIVSTYPGWK